MGHYAKRFFGKVKGEPRDPDFVITVDCRSRTDYGFRFREGPKDVVIDWGNGKTSESTSSSAEEFSAPYSRGIYQIRIKGSFPGIHPNTNTLGRLISLDQWGTNEFTTMEEMFLNETNMEANYTDSPNTSNVTNMRRMFSGCSKFNGKVDFNTQNVTNMSVMFQNCTEFNREVNFNTQNVTDMRWMFNQCAKFNQKVNFNTQNVTTMWSMFQNCVEFNQKVEFDTSNVTDISYMLLNTPVQQSFASWDVTSLTSATNFINTADINEPGNTDNYDNTLISWGNQDVKSGVKVRFGNSKYSEVGKVGRDKLIAKGWVIEDGGMI